MSYPVFYVPAGDVLPVPFSTYAGSTGASATLTGLAVTDIEIYKDGSVTQRASDAGYTLLDTDGIDFDGITGIHGFSIDTGDNTDAGFYTVGAWFTVVISAITVDSQTVNFIAAQFRLMPAESVAGKPKVDVDTFGGTAGTFAGGRPEVNTTHAAGTAWGSGAITAASIAADAITDAKVAADVTIASVTGAVGSVTAGVTVTTNNDKTGYALSAAGVDAVWDEATVGHVTAGSYGVAVTDILTDTAEIGAAGAGLTALASQASVNTIDDFLDTEVAAIKAVTDLLPNGGALTNLDAAISTRATPAQVNAEVVDALATDTYAEPTGVPAATASLSTKLGVLHMALRNRVDVTATKKTFYDDGGLAEWEKDLSDDGTTYSESEGNVI